MRQCRPSVSLYHYRDEALDAPEKAYTPSYLCVLRSFAHTNSITLQTSLILSDSVALNEVRVTGEHSLEEVVARFFPSILRRRETSNRNTRTKEAVPIPIAYTPRLRSRPSVRAAAKYETH